MDIRKVKKLIELLEESGVAEIEIEVRTGAHLSLPAPDGTKVSVETTLGYFESNGSTTEVWTTAGRAVLSLVLEQPSSTTIAARVGDAEARLVIDVDDRGSMQIGPS